MEKISELLKQNNIILDLKSKQKIQAIKELSQLLIDQNLISDEKAFFEAILKRENLESTGIGMGVAIPHARTKAVEQLVLAFARSESGVDFSSLDKKVSHLIFLIAAPEEQKSHYIMTLAKLSKLLRNEAVRTQLKRAEDEREVMEIIKKHEEK